MLAELQKRAAQAIVNVFETGKVHGDYGQVTLLRNDSGHLTYGRSQTTLASGNLYLLIKAYCETEDAQFADAMQPYLEPLTEKSLELDNDKNFHGLLKQAGEDPVMHKVQDAFFDRVYWVPSVQRAEAAGITSGLGTGIVYDSCIHGSWGFVQNETNKQHGLPHQIGENKWVRHYVNVRQDWLANHRNVLLHRTVYRMDAFSRLIGEDRWTLSLPFHVRGVRIDEGALGVIPIRVSAEEDLPRMLLLKSPAISGDDVRAVQQALIRAGWAMNADGIFGAGTDKAVREFQKQHGLKNDGIVGQATRSALGL